MLIPLIGTELMPTSDSGDFSVSVKMPVGTALDETNKAMQQVERIVNGNPDVLTAFATTGTGGRGRRSQTLPGFVDCQAERGS